jgi:hypothetical protein
LHRGARLLWCQARGRPAVSKPSPAVKRARFGDARRRGAGRASALHRRDCCVGRGRRCQEDRRGGARAERQHQPTLEPAGPGRWKCASRVGSRVRVFRCRIERSPRLSRGGERSQGPQCCHALPALRPWQRISAGGPSPHRRQHALRWQRMLRYAAPAAYGCVSVPGVQRLARGLPGSRVGAAGPRRGGTKTAVLPIALLVYLPFASLRVRGETKRSEAE